MRQPIRLCNCSQRSSRNNKICAAADSAALFMLSKNCRVCTSMCVSVSRRVAKPIDVLRVTSCGPLSRRLMQPQPAQGGTATKTAPIYHFPGTGTVNTGRRVQRQRRLLGSATLPLTLSSSASIPLLTTNGFLNSRRV